MTIINEKNEAAIRELLTKAGLIMPDGVLVYPQTYSQAESAAVSLLDAMGNDTVSSDTDAAMQAKFIGLCAAMALDAELKASLADEATAAKCVGMAAVLSAGGDTSLIYSHSLRCREHRAGIDCEDSFSTWLSTVGRGKFSEFVRRREAIFGADIAARAKNGGVVMPHMRGVSGDPDHGHRVNTRS